MKTGHLIFPVILIAGFIVLMLYLRKGSRRCRWCRTPTVKLDALPEQERNRIEALVRQEGKDPADSYEFCVTCRRIFDQWWFHKDWDMRDRWCACGSGLKSPWDVDTNRLRQAAVDEDLPERCRGSVRFVLSSEISVIYKKNDKTRKVHHVVLMSSFEAVERFERAVGGHRQPEVGRAAHSGTG